MKILKLRMSIWFNKTHQRFGTLWAEKFKSIVVEGHGNPLLRMAQYIDLNPVRAGIVRKSPDYAFCGMTDAKKGVTAAIRGLEWIAKLTSPNLPVQQVVAWYEEQLDMTIDRHMRTAAYTQSAFDRSRPLRLLDRQECFSKSLAVGSREFLDLLIERFSTVFSRRARIKGPQGKAILDEETVFFGRAERPRKP